MGTQNSIIDNSNERIFKKVATAEKLGDYGRNYSCQICL